MSLSEFRVGWNIGESESESESFTVIVLRTTKLYKFLHAVRIKYKHSFKPFNMVQWKCN